MRTETLVKSKPLRQSDRCHLGWAEAQRPRSSFPCHWAFGLRIEDAQLIEAVLVRLTEK